VFFGGFGGADGRAVRLAARPAAGRWRDAIGLVGSGVIVGVIVLFVAVGALAAHQRLRGLRRRRQGRLRRRRHHHSLPDRHPGRDLGLPQHRLHGRAGERIGSVGALGLDTDFVPALPVG
jgi:hypothetical protein